MMRRGALPSIVELPLFLSPDNTVGILLVFNTNLLPTMFCSLGLLTTSKVYSSLVR